jgi:hypothetical protein
VALIQIKNIVDFETELLIEMGIRFQKEELLADDPSLAARFSEYTKSFPRRTFSLSIKKKSISRWEGMRVAAGCPEIYLIDKQN